MATSGILARSRLLWAMEAVRLPAAGGSSLFEPYPYQAAILADRAQRRIVLKARQTGITTVAAVEAGHEAIHRPGSLSLVVSRDQNAAADVLRTVAAVMDLLGEPPVRVRESASELVLENGSRIVSQPATAKAGRGYTATLVVLDEFAFAEHGERIYRAALPALARGGRLLVISTPNGQGNLFYRLWNGQEGGDWSRHRVHWRDCPAFDGGWSERERPRYTAEQWASEFECDFVASGGAAFDPEDVERMREGWAGLREPEPGRDYVTGCDTGRRHDPTVIVTLDVTAKPYQVVGYRRMLRAPYAQTQAAIDDVATIYGGTVAVESNSIGDPIIEGLTCSVEPFVTSAKSKADALTRLVRAVEQGELKCGVEQVLSEFKGYQWDDQGIVQDSVMALAIALAGVAEAGSEFVAIEAWDRAATFIPTPGTVDRPQLVLAVAAQALDDDVHAVAVSRHWRREQERDVLVRHVRRLHRGEIGAWLGEIGRDVLDLVEVSYPEGAGLDEEMRALSGLTWRRAYSAGELADAAVGLRSLILGGRLRHGDDAGLRAAVEAASLRVGTDGQRPRLGARFGDIGLVRALAVATERCLYLNVGSRALMESRA